MPAYAGQFVALYNQFVLTDRSRSQKYPRSYTATNV